MKDQEMDKKNMDSRIPVTIITGFLGSGKTTLLNRLIKEHPDKKFAIIENEFGEVGIDSELVVGVEDGIFEMSNGCVCCSLNDELLETLLKLANRKDKIDQLIVETTGIADPAPVAMSFLSDFNIKSIFRLDAIITIADAQFLEQQLENQKEACMQVAMADLVLINKVDRVEPYLKDTLTNIIRRMNAEAEIRESIFGAVAGLDLLNLHAFSKDNIINPKSVKVDVLSLKNFTPASRSATGKSMHPANTSLFSGVVQQHHSGIASHSFVFPEPLDILRFDIWLRMMLNHSVFVMYRVKGILNFKALEEKLVLQAVNNQYVTESGGHWDEKERVSKLVFIGKNIDKDILLKGLKECCSSLPFDPEEFYNAIK